jgi:hypothetical protein
MNSNVLVSNLEQVGWKDFAPGEFLKVEFDHIGTAKIAKNDWFVLLKSVPVLDVAAIETLNQTYKDLTKRSPARMFSRGKYFILILLVDTIGADALEWLSGDGKLEFLESPDIITNGGGYSLMLIKDRKQIAMPKAVKLWDLLRAVEFTKRTNQALADYKDSLAESS